MPTIDQTMPGDSEEEKGVTVGVMAEKLRSGIVDVTQQIGEGFQSVMIMYTVAFYMGVALIGVAVVSSLITKETTLPLITGGVGLGDVIGLLIFQPAEKLQTSRGNLAQLEAAYAAWVNDVHNWNLYWKKVVESGGNPLTELQGVSRVMLDNTERIMRLIDQYVEGKTPTRPESPGTPDPLQPKPSP